MSFGTKKVTTPPTTSTTEQDISSTSDEKSNILVEQKTGEEVAQSTPALVTTTTTSIAPVKMSMKLAPKKPGNVFAMANKKLGGEKKSVTSTEPKRPMSEAERIMKQELERKRNFSSQGGSNTNFKRQKV